jgi:phosphoglycolate phosphatase
MIGDTEYDMEMARNARTHALAVSYGVHHPERLLRHQPLGCLERIGDLPAWLNENSKLQIQYSEEALP